MNKKAIITTIIITTLILVLSSCTSTKITKSKFMEHIENGEYQLANSFYENNKESEDIKNELPKIMEILDGDIDKMLENLHNENTDLVKAIELTNLYKNLASANGLSIEKGTALRSTADMYIEINTIRNLLDQNKYNDVAFWCIATTYSDVEVYRDMLMENIDETAKKEIIAELYNAIDYHIERADGNWTFVKIPFISEKTAYSNAILNDVERNKLMKKIDDHNSSRTCRVKDCTEWTKYSYCGTHKCEDDECSNMHIEYSDYCAKHICQVSGCESYNDGDTYCLLHECDEDEVYDCTNYASHGKYCGYHNNKNRQKNDESSSSSDHIEQKQYITSVTCNACNGTGKGSVRYRSDHYKSKLPCDICGGDGKVDKKVKY